MHGVLISFEVILMAGLLSLLAALRRARDGNEDAQGFHQPDSTPKREPVTAGH